MSIPNQGPRQVFLYNHGRPHWSQGGPIFYDRRITHQVAIGAQFQNHQLPAAAAGQWFRGPVIAGPQSPRRFQNFRVNITWNAPYQNNLNIQLGRNSYNNNHHNYHHHRGSSSGGVASNMRPHMVGGRLPQHFYSGADTDDDSDICFICGDFLQNSNEQGVHLCDGGQNGVMNQQGGGHDDRGHQGDNAHNNLNNKLDVILQNIKSALKNDYQTVSEAFEKYFTERVSEISTIHREVVDDRDALTVLRKDLARRAEELRQRDKDLQELQGRMDKEKEKLEADGKKEREEIARQWQQLRDEITRMEELHNVQKGRIKLDVGGHVFTTSMLTLTRDPDSMLAAMFSGRHMVKMEEDGTVFIDRDGTHFRYILNYLRDGGVTVDALPRNRQILRELRNEAVYFQLHGLVQQIEKLL